MNAYPMFEHCYFHQRDYGTRWGQCSCGEVSPVIWLPISMAWTGACDRCGKGLRGEPVAVRCPQCPQEVSSGVVAYAR